MVAALKFFLGQDQAAEDESDDDDDEDFKAVQPSKAEVYKANSKVCVLMNILPACPPPPPGWVCGIHVDRRGCMVLQPESCCIVLPPLCLLERSLHAGCKAA